MRNGPSLSGGGGAGVVRAGSCVRPRWCFWDPNAALVAGTCVDAVPRAAGLPLGLAPEDCLAPAEAGKLVGRFSEQRPAPGRLDGASAVRVDVTAGTRAAGAGTLRATINPRHHQGIARIGDGGRAAAGSFDGVIEAFEQPSHRYALGVQRHPETLNLRARLGTPSMRLHCPRRRVRRREHDGR